MVARHSSCDRSRRQKALNACCQSLLAALNISNRPIVHKISYNRIQVGGCRRIRQSNSSHLLHGAVSTYSPHDLTGAGPNGTGPLKHQFIGLAESDQSVGARVAGLALPTSQPLMRRFALVTAS